VLTHRPSSPETSGDDSTRPDRRVARYGDKPVGYLDLIVYRNNAWAGRLGFDYEFQGTLPLYFGVLFYGLTDFASSTHLASIDYAVAAERAKTSRGCIPRRTHRVIRVLDAAAHDRFADWTHATHAQV
jgi:hypothetical protein